MGYWKLLLIGSLFTAVTGCTTAPVPESSDDGGQQQDQNNDQVDTTAETYTVKKGDTVFSIMRETGVYWKDIIEINNLKAPRYVITPGQVLLLVETVK